MRKNICRVAGAVFLALAIAFSQVPASFVEAIGTGTNFKMNGDTLISYTGTASVVSVPAGTKTIATDAFAGNEQLTQIRFPSSLETIENGAFRNCEKLVSVTFPSGLEVIESGAFSMCDSLSEVVLSDTVIEIGAGVFSGDKKLKTIDVGNNINFIVINGALYNRSQTKLIQVLAGRRGDDFVMPQSVTDIERYAFWGCNNLENVSLSSNLSEIPEYSFSNCKNLETISLPYSVRKIAAKAFEDCGSLEYIFLPSSVTDIHSTAFDGCYQLSIDAQEGTSAYEFAQTFETSIAALMESEGDVSANTIGDIYKDVRENKTDLEVEENGEDETDDEDPQEDSDKNKLPEYDPSNPADVSALDVSDYYGQDSDDLIGKTRVVGGNAVVLYNTETVRQAPAGSTDGESLEGNADDFQPDMMIQDNGQHLINKKAYYQDNTLKNIELENGIESINDFAFSRSSITGIKIPDSVTRIGYGAFYHCDVLKDVIIPSSVQTIEPEAFARTPYLNEWKKQSSGDDFLVVGDGILLSYRGNASRVYLPENVKKIAGGAFKNHPEITEVYLGNQVTEIGEDAFYGCTSLVQVEGGENVTKIADRAFALCPLLSLHIPESVSEIGLGAFKLAAPDAVIFESNEKLPSVSYEKTATRLDNDGYRSLIFSDVTTMVIDNYNMDLKNTIADERYMGFRGMVVTYDGDKDSGSVVLVACTALPDERTGLVKIPSSVTIDDKNYSLSKALPNAFSAYTTYNYWGEGDIKGILLPSTLGKLSDYKPALTFDSGAETGENGEVESGENVESAQNTQNSETATAPQEYVTTIVMESEYENAESIKGNVVDDDAGYLLYVDQNPEDEQKLKATVEKEYGSLVNGQLTTLDLTVVEQKTNVPITNFGDTVVEVKIPVSDTMMQQDICVVTLSEDGELETIYGVKQTQDNLNYFVFKTNHFSPYGIYAGIGEVAEKIKVESERLLSKDDSPDTGEYFDPKWILVVFFGVIGLLLIINNPITNRFIKDKT